MKILKSGMNCPANEDSIPLIQIIGPEKQIYGTRTILGTQSGISMSFIGNTAYTHLSWQLADGSIIHYTCYNGILVDVNGYKNLTQLEKIFSSQYLPKRHCYKHPHKPGLITKLIKHLRLGIQSTPANYSRL